MDITELNRLKDLLVFLDPVKLLLFFSCVGAMGLFVRSARRLAQKIESQFPSHRLLALQIFTVISFCTYIFGTLGVTYAIFHPPKELLLALGGSAAVAVGFSLKDIVSSVVAGFILLFDRPFQVGDRVTFGDLYGEIQSIGLRTVRLQTLNDDIVTIPNNKFLTDVVSSGNMGDLKMMVVTSFVIDSKADLRLASEKLKEVVVTSRYIHLGKEIKIVLSEQMGYLGSYFQLTVKAYVLDVKYEKSFQTDVLLRGNEALSEYGISKPNQSELLYTKVNETPST